jgi:hypothetical protein
MLDMGWKRLSEPSTWAGLGVILSVAGVHIAPEQWQAVVALVTAVAGAVAVFAPEKNA